MIVTIHGRCENWLTIFASVLLLSSFGSFNSVSAETANLSFSPQAATAAVDDIIEIELYVYSVRPQSPALSFVDALLIWDPTRLELLQANPASCFDETFLLCGFSPNPDMLNQGSGSPNLPDNDGDALHSSLTNLTPPLFVPSTPGLRVTTFRFRAIAETSSTTVSLLGQWPGGISRTRVFAPGNQEITGDITGAMTVIRICGSTPDDDGDGVANDCDACPGADDHLDADSDGLPDGCDPCPFVATPGIIQGDVDDNGVVDLLDLDDFVSVLLGLDANPDRIDRSDINCDGTANGLDVQGFVEQLT